MEEFVYAQAYTGCYGGESKNNADIIITKISCPEKSLGDERKTLIDKQIIFVVDESGSMIGTIDSVRTSLIAARNTLLILMGHKIKFLDERSRDELFSKDCNCSLITFSNKAKLKWKNSMNTNITFSEAVSKIHAKCSTNMGDALRLAFQEKEENCATWIILLTDGISNKGSYQTIDGFRNLLKEIPPHTKIIPLGYTTCFDPDILSILGNMTYVESEENIAEIFGSIIGEIITCYAMDAEIILPKNVSSKNDFISEDEIIVASDDFDHKERDIIGSTNIGCLFSGRIFYHGWLPWGNTQNPNFSQYIGLEGYVKYYDIIIKQEITVPFIINKGCDVIPEDVCEQYFNSSKSRILLNIYKYRKNNNLTLQFINGIKTKLDDWHHPSSIPHKEEILRNLSNSRTKNDEYLMISRAVSVRSQNNYTSNGPYTTNMQKNVSNLSSSEATSYIPH